MVGAPSSCRVVVVDSSHLLGKRANSEESVRDSSNLLTTWFQSNMALVFSRFSSLRRGAAILELH